MNTEYFTYLPENRTCASWGCTVRGLGHARTAPGSPYPPQRHPDDHHFTWERGRVIDAFQIVMISGGSGTFESARTRSPQAVQAGSLFVLFPSVWHRYAPDPDTGWTEHWIECRGHAFDAALKKRALSPSRPVRPAGADCIRLFSDIHAWAVRGSLAHQTMISAQGLQLLALLTDSSRDGGNEAGALVQRAMMQIHEHSDKRISMRQLAAGMNIGYTRFRELFQEHARTSPKQYHLRIRLERARDLLLNTTKPVKEIATLLGFENPFHFSNQFRKIHGLSPRAWRTRDPGRES